MFKGKTDEEKAGDLVAQEAAGVLKAQQEAAANAERTRAAFAASPAGLAVAAKAAGRRYFQIVRDVSTSQASATWQGNVSQGGNTDQTGLIESVEDQGWALHDVGYVFQETASDSKSKALGSGERTAISGKIVGIFLFKIVTAPAS